MPGLRKPLDCVRHMTNILVPIEKRHRKRVGVLKKPQNYRRSPVLNFFERSEHKFSTVASLLPFRLFECFLSPFRALRSVNRILVIVQHSQAGQIWP